jgi:hypothetical protein
MTRRETWPAIGRPLLGLFAVILLVAILTMALWSQRAPEPRPTLREAEREPGLTLRLEAERAERERERAQQELERAQQELERAQREVAKLGRPAPPPGEAGKLRAESKRSPRPTDPASSVGSPTNPDVVPQILAKLDKGALAFNAPDELKVGHTAIVHVAISRELTEPAVASRLVGPGPRESASIPIAARMEARLTGSKADFTIEALAEGVQAVDPRWTEWRWAVTPLRSGIHRLRLEIFVQLRLDDASTPRSVKVHDRDIVVHAAPLEKVTAFVKGNWQWLWATLLVPLVPWVLKKLRKKDSFEG